MSVTELVCACGATSDTFYIRHLAIYCGQCSRVINERGTNSVQPTRPQPHDDYQLPHRLPQWETAHGDWYLRLSTVTLGAVRLVKSDGMVSDEWAARLNLGHVSQPVGLYSTAAEACRAAIVALIPLLQFDLVALDGVLESD